MPHTGDDTVFAPDGTYIGAYTEHLLPMDRRQKDGTLHRWVIEDTGWHIAVINTTTHTMVNHLVLPLNLYQCYRNGDTTVIDSIIAALYGSESIEVATHDLRHPLLAKFDTDDD